MTVNSKRISQATIQDIIFYDPAAERRASQMQVDWDKYFNVGSQEILYHLEFAWWPKHADYIANGIFNVTVDNQIASGFDICKLIKTDQTLIRLDTFKAIEIFYESIVSDVSNVNDVDKANYDHSQNRYNREWQKAMQLVNFYKVPNHNNSSQQPAENYTVNQTFWHNDRRYF